MIIGIMSDTHGDLKRTDRAIAAFRKFKLSHIIHCGDIGSFDVLAKLAEAFAKPMIQVTLVLGNVDIYNDDLISAWSHIQIEGRFASLTLDDKRVAVVHGDDFNRLTETSNSGVFNYIFTGHTHVRADDRVGRTRVINPGALHRAIEPGCAVLNLRTDELTYISVV